MSWETQILTTLQTIPENLSVRPPQSRHQHGVDLSGTGSACLLYLILSQC